MNTSFKSIFSWVIDPSQTLDAFEDQKGKIRFKLSNFPEIIDKHRISGIKGTDLQGPLKRYIKVSLIREEDEDNIFIPDHEIKNSPVSGSHSNVSFDEPLIDLNEIFKRFSPKITHKDNKVFVEFKESPYIIKSLFFKTLTGSTITVENINSSVKISEIKERVLEKVKIDQLRLIYSGKQLEDNRTIYDYSIRNESLIHCTSRLKGGRMSELTPKNSFNLENIIEQCINCLDIVDVIDNDMEKFPIIEEIKIINYKNNDDSFKKFCKLLEELGDIDTKNKIKKYQESQNLNCLKEITKLNLASCALKELPKEIKLLENLISLNLVNNKLEDLPIELASLRQLKILRLEGNSLKHVPHVLKEMTWLDQLFLDCNPLKELPVFLNEDSLRSYPTDAYWVDS
ncbi:MAG: hypothetical protein H0V82_01300 [Candidatus Protochlamydia sp.]|nr:hypothetical protein [Candidatus Protochlamydia sp.]